MRRCILGLLLLAACEGQDASDQRHLRRLCGLPQASAVVAWQGYPAVVGFGQREGLALSGTFRPPPGWRPETAGYRAAPWPAAREAAERAFRLGSEVDAAVALRCETAGDDVLHARTTRPCDQAERPLDVILCGVDAGGAVRVTVRSAY